MQTIRTYILAPITRITKSGTLTDDENWTGEVHITGNLTIPTGVTLNIHPGTTVVFDNNFRITAYGTLIADDAVFTSNNPPNKWIELKIISDNSEIRDCIIEHASRGAYLNNSNMLLSGCTIQDCDLGVYIYGSSAEPTIEKCNITNNDYAIYNRNGSPNVMNNKFNSTFNSHTIRIYNGHGWYRNNTIENPNGDGVYIYGSTASPQFCANFGQDYYGMGGYNVLDQYGCGDHIMENNSGTRSMLN